MPLSGWYRIGSRTRLPFRARGGCGSKSPAEQGRIVCGFCRAHIGGPHTTAAFLIPPARLPSVFVSLAFQPSRSSGRLASRTLVPRWRQASKPPAWYASLRGVPGSPCWASVPHAGLAPAHTQPGDAHPPADRRRWLCDIVSGLYATTQWRCAAGMWLE